MLDNIIERLYHMEMQGIRNSDAEPTAGDKLAAAFELLTSAFQDSRIDSTALAKQDLVEQAIVAQRTLNAVWALQSARLAQAAAIEKVAFPDATAPEGFREHEVRHAFGTHRDEFIGSELGPQFGWTSGQALNRVAEATDAITRTPRLFGHVGTGELEPAKLTSIHRALGRVARETTEDGTPATLDLARQVETALLGDPDDASTAAEAAAVEHANVDLLARQSAPRVQHRTQRILRTLDPITAGRAATRRRRDRVGVFAHPDDEPGLTHLHAILPSAVAAKIMAAIDRHARDLHADTSTDKTLAECRADAIADLILGNATITTHLVIHIPVHTAAAATAAAAGTAARTTAGAAAGATSRQAAGGSGSGWPGAFAHPVTGATVFPHGRPTTPTPTTGRPAGVTVRSQDEIDREFNELLKHQYRPCDADFADWELDDAYAPTDLDLHADELAGTTPPSAASAGGAPPSPAPRAPAARSGTRLGDATVPGIGTIPADVIEAMSRSFGMTMTRALIDADTGVTLETCETRYRPSTRLQRFVQTRDRHCRFPGCTTPAHRCDLDHLTPWPQGATAAHNLQCLCRHHHRTKQENGWTVTMTPDGVCTWTSPTGRDYITTPGE